MTRTISWFEFIWTLASAVGFIVNFRICLGASIDLLVVKIRRINSIREYAAVTSVIMFGSWAFIQFVFVLVGVNAMTYAANSQHTSKQAVAAVLFVTASAMLSITGIVVDRRRVALRKKIEEIES